MSGAPIEVWRGAANAWECDHLGHLNTRFYLARVELALATLLSELGLSGDSVTVQAQHMRFHKEVRAGTPIHALGQVIRWGTSDAELLVQLIHSVEGAVAATFRLDLASASPAAWPTSASSAARGLLAELPKIAQRRGLSDLDGSQAPIGLAQAESLGLHRTGLSLVQASDCSPDGYWRLSAAMGFVADSVPHLEHGDWREVLARTASTRPLRIGGALVEFGFRHYRWPRQGDRVGLWSALSDCTDRVTRTVHWLLDPRSGEPWAAVRTVGVALDLDARRLVALTPEAQEAYRRHSVSI